MVLGEILIWDMRLKPVIGIEYFTLVRLVPDLNSDDSRRRGSQLVIIIICLGMWKFSNPGEIEVTAGKFKILWFIGIVFLWISGASWLAYIYFWAVEFKTYLFSSERGWSLWIVPHLVLISCFRSSDVSVNGKWNLINSYIFLRKIQIQTQQVWNWDKLDTTVSTFVYWRRC
jgi:hypothetical protein